MKIIFLYIVLIALLSGCNTVEVTPKKTSPDKSAILREGEYKSFYVQAEREMVVRSQKMMGLGDEAVGAGRSKSMTSRGEAFQKGIEEVIIKKFESLGMVYKEQNYDLHIIYDPHFFTQSKARDRLETTGWMQIVGADPVTMEKLFDIQGSFESFVSVSISLLQKVAENTLSELEVFQESDSRNPADAIAEKTEPERTASKSISDNGNMISVVLISDWNKAQEEWSHPTLPDTPVIEGVDTYAYGMSVIPLVLYSFQDRGEGDYINAVMRGKMTKPGGHVLDLGEVLVRDGYHPEGIGMNEQTFAYLFEAQDDKPGYYKLDLEIENRISGELYRFNLGVLLKAK